MIERRESGDFKDIPLIEATKLMASEYKTLSAGEKKVGRTTPFKALTLTAYAPGI